MMDPTRFVPRAGRLGAWTAIWFGVIAWGVTLPYTQTGMAIASLGWVAIVFGVWAGHRAPITTGAVLLVGAMIVAAGNDAPAHWVVIGTSASILAWDAGENAVGLRDHLGPAAETVRTERTHVGVGALVGGIIAAVVLAGAAVGGPVQPVLAVVYLLLAGLLLAIALGPSGIVPGHWFES